MQIFSLCINMYKNLQKILQVVSYTETHGKKGQNTLPITTQSPESRLTDQTQSTPKKLHPTQNYRRQDALHVILFAFLNYKNTQGALDQKIREGKRCWNHGILHGISRRRRKSLEETQTRNGFWNTPKWFKILKISIPWSM